MAKAKARKRVPRLSAKAQQRIRAVALGAAEYYRTTGRDFPWRQERDPYRLAVAEILLQKTRAQSVIATYGQLAARYADARSLSKAGIEELECKLLPLGLSRKRAEQLVQMSRAVLEYGDAIFDDWKIVLAEVPGIGAYAARAIASFARGERVGIVDANIARILRRVFRVATHDPRAVVFQRYADEVALASEDVRATNFGLLDIGALVCLPKPRCDICPLKVSCSYARDHKKR